MVTDTNRFADELPSSCRSQMDAMEHAVRTEDFCIAELSGNTCGEIQDLEGRLSKDLGKKISLVAYEDRSR